MKQKKTVQISFLPSEFAELPAEVRVFTLYENNWRDEFRGHEILRLLTPSEEPIATFEGIEDGGCYRAVRTIDHLLKSSQVVIDREVYHRRGRLLPVSSHYRPPSQKLPKKLHYHRYGNDI